MKTMVNTRIETSIKHALQEVATEEDRSLSYIIRRILLEWLKKHRNFKLPHK
jgi:hypothetical protein